MKALRGLSLVLLFITGCGRSPVGQTPPHAINVGDWVSSGGERFKDAINPWWVKNTSEVSYCIEVDQTSFTAAPEMISKVVDKALSDWRKEFARQVFFFNDPFKQLDKWNELGVGQQTFTKVVCNGAEDLRFQFGFGTLTALQKSYLLNPLHFVAVAVRTSYDEKNLKGRGFIFVGSDIGANRFAPDTQAERVWETGTSLYLAVVHELGHVFGLPHVGNRYTLMGAGILELFTHKALAPFLKEVAMDYEQEFYFFAPRLTMRSCFYVKEEPALKIQKYFNLEEKQNCLEFTFNPQTKEMVARAFPMVEKMPKVEVGKLTALNLTITSWPTSGVVMILNPVQTTFPTLYPTFPLALMNGPFFVAGQGGAKLVLKNGEERPVHLRLGIDQLELSGIWEGAHQNILMWNAWGGGVR